MKKNNFDSVKKTLNDSNVVEMFQNILGTTEGSISFPIAYVNFLKIKNVTRRFILLMDNISRNSLLNIFPDIKEITQKYTLNLAGLFTSTFTDIKINNHFTKDYQNELLLRDRLEESDFMSIPKLEIDDFISKYMAIKKCAIVNLIIVTCKNLIVHKKSISDLNNLKDKFITRSAGLTFNPIADLQQLNIKKIYIDSRLDKISKDYILTFLHKVFDVSVEMYNILSNPDVDIEEFVSIIMGSIEEVKKAIPRCDQAFQKIIDSISLLKGNFNNYYKDFTISGNPTIIMENFVLDVSKNTKSSPTVMAQFRKIISHYRKLASQHASNPKLQSLFSQVDANFKELEKCASDDSDDSEDSKEDLIESSNDSKKSSNDLSNYSKESSNDSKEDTSASNDADIDASLDADDES
jgi:hypothetical protein